MNLQAVTEEFERNFSERNELGASLSIWQNGREILSLAKGITAKDEGSPAWTKDTLVPVYSATKGPAAATLLLALERHGMNAKTEVGEVWPRFPLPHASFEELLSHQCGLAALDISAQIWNHEEVVAAVEAQTPEWSPGPEKTHGYHPRTLGILMEEPVRKLTGQSLGSYWQSEIARPLGIDFWIGLPSSEHHRVATLFPGRAGSGTFQTPFYKAFQTSGSLQQRAFSSPRGLHAVREMNDPRAWGGGFPAMGGIGTAAALAKFYQAASGIIPSPISLQIQHALQTPLVNGEDLVLLMPTSFACGCQLDPIDPEGRKIRFLYGPNRSSFGHPGAGGSHAFADPENCLSFAYTMNQMELSIMPGTRVTKLLEALYNG